MATISGSLVIRVYRDIIIVKATISLKMMLMTTKVHQKYYYKKDKTKFSVQFLMDNKNGRIIFKLSK